MAERKVGCGCVPDMLAPPHTPSPRHVQGQPDPSPEKAISYQTK